MRVYFSGSISQSGVTAIPIPGARCIRRPLFAFAIIVLLPSGQAVARNDAGLVSAQPAVAADRQTGQPEKTGKVCQYEDVTGSRMKKRLCYTPEQWAERERVAKELKREMDDKPISKDANGG